MSRWQARYHILSATPERIVLQDLGPWDMHPTITNAAEEVLAALQPDRGQRVFYWDSLGELTELLHEGAAFLGYAPAQPEALELVHPGPTTEGV